MRRELRVGFDRVVRTAPFGVRFRDAVSLGVVADGLKVEMHDARRSGRVQPLAASPHGTFVAHALPGLNAMEEAVPGFPDTPIADRFSLQVSDTLGRYLPLAIRIAVPNHGLFAPGCLSASPSAEVEPHLPLFSACTRPLPAALVVVRADLHLASAPERPAPWAWLELRLEGERIAVGMSDEHGSIVLACPQPEPVEGFRHASPPAPPSRGTWEVTLHAHWSPARSVDVVPDLCEVVRQPEVDLLERLAPPTPLGRLTVRADGPLVLATASSSFLFVAA